MIGRTRRNPYRPDPAAQAAEGPAQAARLEEYVFSLPPGLDLPLDGPTTQRYRQVAYKLGLTPLQFRGIVEHYFSHVQEILFQLRMKEERENRRLQDEWRQGFRPRSLRVAALVRRYADKAGPGVFEEVCRLLNSCRGGNNPALVRLFDAIAGDLSEDSYAPNQGPSGRAALTATGVKRLRYPSLEKRTR